MFDDDIGNIEMSTRTIAALSKYHKSFFLFKLLSIFSEYWQVSSNHLLLTFAQIVEIRQRFVKI